MSEQKPYLTLLDEQLKQDERLLRLRQPGIARSFPVFAYQDDQLETRLFFHEANQMSRFQMMVGPPRMCVRLNFATGAYINVEDPATFGITAFEPELHRVAVSQHRVIQEHLQSLRQAYDNVIGLYTGHNASGEIGARFLTDLWAIVPHALIPAYKSLAPDFFDWLRS